MVILKENIACGKNILCVQLSQIHTTYITMRYTNS